ncbi:hypothetical protein DY000_02001602 [Brassica cretica]|uniref:Uncharacterized protein n=1 Tax=Brassica cretica TaxID=69181 RepID=A0ABQ7BWY4_BRACR|nr:hypothetical protein DY000_02001602 [Brassica cretica]
MSQHHYERDSVMKTVEVVVEVTVDVAAEAAMFMVKAVVVEVMMEVMVDIAVEVAVFMEKAVVENVKVNIVVDVHHHRLYHKLKEFRQLAVEHTHSIRGNFVQLRGGLGCPIESLRLIRDDTYMAATARGNDSGASGQATTTRAQPRGRLEAERDRRRSWRIVDSHLWRFRGRRP